MPKLIPAAANMVVRIGNAIVNALPTIAEAGGKLVSSIIEGFQNTDWLELGG